jgi:hypothetical protein
MDQRKRSMMPAHQEAKLHSLKGFKEKAIPLVERKAYDNIFKKNKAFEKEHRQGKFGTEKLDFVSNTTSKAMNRL